MITGDAAHKNILEIFLVLSILKQLGRKLSSFRLRPKAERLALKGLALGRILYWSPSGPTSVMSMTFRNKSGNLLEPRVR